MPDQPPITVLAKEELLSRAMFRWINVRFTFHRFDGTVSEPVERIVFERGDSAGMLLHDLARNEVILLEQVRIATLDSGTGLLLEIPAGVIEPGDSAEDTARREIQEETGAPPGQLVWISSFYPSPGACSERVHLFYAPYPEGVETAQTTGLAAENEDIRVLRVPLEEAFQMVRDGRIQDAKTIIGLQWLLIR
jgi:ADP-ribose pyrophosphatase